MHSPLISLPQNFFSCVLLWKHFINDDRKDVIKEIHFHVCGAFNNFKNRIICSFKVSQPLILFISASSSSCPPFFYSDLVLFLRTSVLAECRTFRLLAYALYRTTCFWHVQSILNSDESVLLYSMFWYKVTALEGIGCIFHVFLNLCLSDCVLLNRALVK